ncbi:MAG: sulfurtransferase TusA family protein [Candidatus Latescibacter sp.]|nr:sulfurtransferase TusA family protein [Candidatus Latescibacter sp.]
MEENVEQRLDLKGVACPMNFVKVKVALAQIEEGQILEIVLDDGEPMRNVPRSVKEEGHKIIKVEKLNDSFRLLVRKGG